MYQSFIYLAVPFFFTTTGALISDKLKQFNNKEDELYFLKKQIKKYIGLYLMWFGIYAPLAIGHYIYCSMQPIEIFKNAVIAFFWLGESYNSFILWYLLSSIYSLTFIFAMRRIKVSYIRILFVGTLIAIFAVFLVVYKNGVWEFPGVWGILLRKVSALGARVTTGFFYVPAGIVLNNIKEKITKPVSSFFIIAGFLLEVISPGYGFSYEFGRAVATIGIVAILINAAIKRETKYRVFRELSSSMYYWHLWVYTLVSFAIYGIGNMHKGLIMYILVVLLIIVGFLLTKAILKRNSS